MDKKTILILARLEAIEEYLVKNFSNAQEELQTNLFAAVKSLREKVQAQGEEI